MITYMLYDWGGQIKWAEYSGCCLVDPGYEEEFLAAVGEARPLPINTNIF